MVYGFDDIIFFQFLFVCLLILLTAVSTTCERKRILIVVSLRRYILLSWQATISVQKISNFLRVITSYALVYQDSESSIVFFFLPKPLLCDILITEQRLRKDGLLLHFNFDTFFYHICNQVLRLRQRIVPACKVIELGSLVLCKVIGRFQVNMHVSRTYIPFQQHH